MTSTLTRPGSTQADLDGIRSLATPGIRTSRPLPSGAAAPRPGGGHARRRTHRSRPRPVRDTVWTAWQWRAFLLFATLATFALHMWRIDSTTDLFIDESFYVQVGQSVAHGSMPYATGSYFFLHPPGFFVLEAVWMHVFGMHSEVFAAVFSIRKLVAVIAGVTALLLGLLTAKAVGRTVAAVVVLLYMVNAFANRDSTLVILEPATMMFTLAGFTVLTRADPNPSRRRSWQLTAAGLLLGIAVLTKEFAVFVTVVPIALAGVFRTGMSRRESGKLLLLTALPWAVWIVMILVTGHWSQFFTQITSGFHRTAGNTQISGFNRAGAPSFLDTIVANLAWLWTAYAVLGLGSIAIVYAAFRPRRNPRLRLIAFVGCGAIPLLGYCVTLGANEEQFFNFLFFPALICLVAVVWNEWRRLGRWLQLGVLALLVCGVVSDGVTYVAYHLIPDNGTYLIDKWMYEHVPAGTAVETTNSVQREIFLRYDMVDDAPGVAIAPQVHWLVVFGKQVDQGYAFVDRSTVDAQVRGQRLVYQVSDRSNGRMSIYAIH